MSDHEQVEVQVAEGAFLRATVRGEGPPVLLLHGIPGAAIVWDAVAEELKSAFRVITPDLLGFGDSSRVKGISLLSVSQASAVYDLLVRLNVQNPTVVGHDFGGPVALTMERMIPGTIGRLMLSATNTFPDTPIPFPLSSILWPVVGGAARKAIFSRASLAMMLKQGAGKGARLDPTHYLGDPAQSDAIASIFSYSLVNLKEVYSPVEATLRELNIPTSVIWGTKDPFFPVAQGERTAEAAGAPLKLYEGAGHFLPEERPLDFARDITAFALAPTEELSASRR
jgi:pimeloyl-ACP methyl ester carboxylesterase